MKTAGAAMGDGLSPQGEAAGMGRLRREWRVGELLHSDDEQGSSVVNCGWRMEAVTTAWATREQVGVSAKARCARSPRPVFTVVSAGGWCC